MILYLRAFWQLFRYHFDAHRGGFDLLHARVSISPVTPVVASTGDVKRICTAMDIACLWYPKHVQCLQRAVATACLLRLYGVPAQMVLGAQTVPFRAHAWVEVEGSVVNDKPYTPEIYPVLHRCGTEDRSCRTTRRKAIPCQEPL